LDVNAIAAETIRTALVERLKATLATSTGLILHELSVGSGRVALASVGPRWYVTRGLRYYVAGRNSCVEFRTARADVALLTHDALDLFEIKGPGDSLVRLRVQAPAYDDTGSRNTLVIDERHARHAVNAIPSHWGILVALGRPARLHELRTAQPNPSRNARGLTNPLYRRELLPLAQAYGAAMGSRSDFVEFFATHGGADIELLERWLRALIARRNRTVARGPFGTVAGAKKRPVIEIGDRSEWYDPRLAVLLGELRARHARLAPEFEFAQPPTATGA
jgi:hypothetical protein